MANNIRADSTIHIAFNCITLIINRSNNKTSYKHKAKRGPNPHIDIHNE